MMFQNADTLDRLRYVQIHYTVKGSPIKGRDAYDLLLVGASLSENNQMMDAKLTHSLRLGEFRVKGNYSGFRTWRMI